MIDAFVIDCRERSFFVLLLGWDFFAHSNAQGIAFFSGLLGISYTERDSFISPLWYLSFAFSSIRSILEYHYLSQGVGQPQRSSRVVCGFGSSCWSVWPAAGHLMSWPELRQCLWP